MTIARGCRILTAFIFISAVMSGCSSQTPTGDPVAPEYQYVLFSESGSSDRFLGEFLIVTESDNPTLIETRSGQTDFNGTDLLSITNPLAPVYLSIPAAEWLDDPAEPDPNQGTWHYTVELRNNTNLSIYDPWLIFIDLGLKEYMNPHGITSRAFINPDDPSFASRPYVSFGNDEEIFEPHSSMQVICDLFLPKEAENKLAPIKFVAYGSWPDNYIDVGEGAPDESIWREAFDAAGGRGIVGSAIDTVASMGPAGISQYSNDYQRFDNGIISIIIEGPCAGQTAVVTGVFFEKWGNMGAKESPLGLPLSGILNGMPSGGGDWCDGEPSLFNSQFVQFEFGRIYIALTGAPDLPVGQPIVVHSEIWEAYRECDPDFTDQFCDQYTLSPEAELFGLPKADMTGPCLGLESIEGMSQEFEGGELIHYPGQPSGFSERVGIWGPVHSFWVTEGANNSKYGWPKQDIVYHSNTDLYDQEFQNGIITWDCTTGDVYDNLGDDIDFQCPVSYPTGDGYHLSQAWMTYMYGIGYHLGDDWDGDGDPDSDYGDPFYAVEAGEVVSAGNHGGIWGNIIFVRHDDVPGVGTVTSMYAHCKDINVTTGELVSAGQLLGTIGDNSGILSPHLHLEIRLGTDITADKSHNPTPVTQGPQGQVDPTEFIEAY